MTHTVTCATIGEGNLHLCCLQELHQSGIQVNVVFTNTKCVETFCDEQDIRCHKRNENLVEILRIYETDILFSISNPRILKEDVLRIPKRLTINYHDSPLPAYAGVHATSWAIMRGERYHGISWHIVEVGIDTGDILQSETVEILEEDSAFTLNLKCTEASKIAFSRLLDEVVCDNIKQKKQAEQGRSYFGLHAIPPNIGVLNFTENIDNVYNLARALRFGHTENALGSPKVKTSTGEFLLVTNATKPEKCRCDKDSTPGTILEIINDTLVIATGSSPIHISIASLDGSSISERLFSSHGLVVGHTVENNTNIDVSNVTAIRKKEAFWKRKLTHYEPTMFYRQKMNVVASFIDISTEVSVKSVNMQVPPMKDSLTLVANKGTFLQACFVAFLARINCTPTVHVGLLTEKTNIPEECIDLYSDVTPGIFSIDNKLSVKEVLDECQKEIKLHKDARTFLRDVFYRYPELRGHQPTPQHNLVMGGTKQQSDRYLQKILHGCNVLILFGGNNELEMEVRYHERPAQDFGHVIDVLQHFETFLNAVNVSEDTTLLKSVSMVSKNEMTLFYKLPPPGENENTEHKSISDLVDRQCNLTPLSIAIKTTSSMMTYNKLAHEINVMQTLLTKSVQPSDVYKKLVVAIHTPNSVSYVISVLALAKCRMAFLPLPFDLPADRIAFTMKDSKVKRMIMTKDSYGKCSLNGLTPYMRLVAEHEIAEEKIVLVEFDRVYQAENETINDFDDTDADFLYLMYTSGSTGRPKGVKVKESGTINLARAQIMCWDIVPGDVIAQFASIGFDATISEIFTALLSGASLAVLGAHERLGSDFIAAMNKMKVSVITLPPSALNIYTPEELPTLMKVVTAGEACTLNTAIKWTSVANIRFFNGYGPTEATVCATVYEHFPDTLYEDVNRDLPIGKAIDGVQVYLFDDFMHPIPPDVVGEIYIGGKGIAHGYIGHACHYTKERFVQNPLATQPSLLYKTGDHAFQDPEGNITYIGRTDDQVKIRGHRIVLSEIEQVLIQHPKICMAVVVVHKCSSVGDLSVAAFIAPTFIYVSELREYLSKVLPRYMMPTYIKKCEVQDLPKTVNGKINRKKLEQDESIHEQDEIDGHSHLNETQLMVARYWCSVFKFDESFVYSLHRHSSFSELGGNSLQLVLLLRLIEDEINVNLSFTDLGTADTIEEFAEVIRRRRDIKTKNEYCEIKTRNELRQLIFHDSELDGRIFPQPDRRRSVQFTHYTTLVTKCTTKKHPKNILLSGVTGFLGAFLLSEILEQSNSHICCMVRETTEARGIGRIIDNMRKYGLWKFEYVSRIAVVISDLSQKNLGIAPDIHKSLCNAIDVVFMNAAHMNFNTPYEDHRIANVAGTKEFIKFASTGVQKYLFITSSLSVFLFPKEHVLGGSGRRICTETEFFDDPLLIEGGYGQSKWASERLIMQALDFLPGGAIFRPARVSGRSTDGVGPKNDLFASTMIGMKKMGAYPDMDFPFDLTPVDFCAKSMIDVTMKVCNSESDAFERVYHLFNKHTMPFRDLFKGMGLRALSLAEWRTELKCTDGTNKELIPFIPFFLGDFWDRAPDWPVFDTRNLDNVISDSAKELMKPSGELLQTYKQFFGV